MWRSKIDSQPDAWLQRPWDNIWTLKLANDGRDLEPGYRLAQKITLHFIAAFSGSLIKLGYVLYAFGRDLHAEAFSKAYDGANDQL